MEFACPHCEHVLRTPESRAGQSARCPACGQPVWVPQPHEGISPAAADGVQGEPFPPDAPAYNQPVDEVEFLEEPAPMAEPKMKHCVECGAQIRERAEICPHCGVRQPMFTPPPPSGGHPDPEVRAFLANKLAAGLCGILVGGFGIHKFILGLNMAGIIMLAVTLVVAPLTCGWGYLAMGVIGVIEGVLYLTKSDEQFYQDYAIEKREWF